jgi:hypothetical protein
LLGASGAAVESGRAGAVLGRRDRAASALVHEGQLRFNSGISGEYVDAFRQYYGPTMNAFDAAEKNGRADDLARELTELFTRQNTSTNGGCSIPATFPRVTVNV